MYLTPKAEHHSCLPMPVLGRQGCQASRVSIAWQKVKPEMPPPQQQSRINLQDLKAQMVKRIGPERASQYFTYFKGYISLRYSKPDLDKRVVLTIGKENIGLHNQIIRAVLSNAVRCEDSPTVVLEQDNVKSTKTVCRKSSTLPNGDVASIKDSSVKTTSKDGGNEVDLGRPIQEVHGSAEQSKDDPNGRLGKRPRINSNSSETNADSYKAQISQVEIESEDMFTQSLDGMLIKAPLGVKFINQRKPGSVGLSGMFSEFLFASDDEREFFEMADLPDEETLHRHMEYIAASEGLQGVNQDCVKILSQGLDIFLKQLITSCVKYVKSSATSQCSSLAKKEEKDHINFLGHKKEQLSDKNFHASHSSGIQKIAEGSHATVSLNDFMGAMELNPEQLGEAWPLQLEKILLRSMD